MTRRQQRFGRALRSSFAHEAPPRHQQALQLDPDDCKTGDEPKTDAQRSNLETLCRETDEGFEDTLSQADASKRIDELHARVAMSDGRVAGR